MSTLPQTGGSMMDEQLMLKFGQGDQVAFEELYARHRQRVYAFYRRRVPGRERADELTQETFLALLHSAGRYQPQAPFRTYLVPGGGCGMPWSMEPETRGSQD